LKLQVDYKVHELLVCVTESEDNDVCDTSQLKKRNNENAETTQYIT